MFDTESNPNREGCLPGDCWQVELTETKEHSSVESPKQNLLLGPGTVSYEQESCCQKHLADQPHVCITASICYKFFLSIQTSKRTRFLVTVPDRALIQFIQLYWVTILRVWPNRGKFPFKARLGEFKTSLAPAKLVKLAAFLSFPRIGFHHCWDGWCCPVNGSSKVLPGQFPVSSLFPTLGGKSSWHQKTLQQKKSFPVCSAILFCLLWAEALLTDLPT